MGSHVALEVQRDMAGSQYDVARSSCSFLGSFGPFELEPRRVGGSTRHGGDPMRRGALVLLSIWGIGLFLARATSRWRPNATWQRPNTTWRTRFPPFWAVLTPLRRSHVVLEVQRDMVGAQCDVARSFCPLLGSFGTFEAEPRRVGGPTRHGSLPMRRGGAPHNLAPPFF